ncbi:hypothetical protein BGZ61DRAFT_70190 [Ilyonectria robusta]|uniref:uncharacterized protein n=1 Tax=Ilyonectria robusta TaxID=1079257 RepID=UPI001E8E16DD|nr:uncharacterized protein BGZ61DRAFT_70190 [Ilyonectria robusta]KAH8679339.1 hypothetical protein BGZ61DRAFT_70190 [Ilyonectria robusta]
MQMLEPGLFATLEVNATSSMTFESTMDSSISTDKPMEEFLNLLRPHTLTTSPLFHSSPSQKHVSSFRQSDFGQQESEDSRQLRVNYPSSIDSPSISPSSTNLFTPGKTPSPGSMETNNVREPQLPCQKGCSRSFKSSKDLLRHYKSRAHIPPSTKVFRCRCGYTNARKDHYRRHLRQHSCTFRHPHYHCVCSQAVLDDNALQHLEHLRVCKDGQGRSGRPRKSEKPVSLGETPPE